MGCLVTLRLTFRAVTGALWRSQLTAICALPKRLIT